jgi:hypothetical protein
MLFEATGVEHTTRIVRLEHNPGRFRNFYKDIKADYKDTTPYLERNGWLQWLCLLLRLDPHEWYTEHKLILETLPRQYRLRLPKGSIPREALPASPGTLEVPRADLEGVNGLDRFANPFCDGFTPYLDQNTSTLPFDAFSTWNGAHKTQNNELWLELSRHGSYYGIFMFKKLSGKDIIFT